MENIENVDFEVVANAETKKKGNGPQIIGNRNLLIYGRMKETKWTNAEVADLIKKETLENWGIGKM